MPWWPPRTGRTRTSATVATGRTCGTSTRYAAAAKQHGPAAGLRYVEENADAGFAGFLEAAGPERLAALAADAGELTPR